MDADLRRKGSDIHGQPEEDQTDRNDPEDPDHAERPEGWPDIA